MALRKKILLFVVCVWSYVLVAGQHLEVKTGPLAMGDDIVAIVSNLSNTNVQENLVGIQVNEGCVIGTK